MSDLISFSKFIFRFKNIIKKVCGNYCFHGYKKLWKIFTVNATPTLK